MKEPNLFPALLANLVSVVTLIVIGGATLIGCFIRFYFLFDVPGDAIAVGVLISLLSLQVLLTSSKYLSER